MRERRPMYAGEDRGVARRNVRWSALLLIVFSAYYIFQGTLGTFGTLSWNTSYYDLLERGFADGHLYIPTKPRRALLRQVDPYSSTHEHMWLWDASLYRGRYYMYFGPTPALCLWAFKAISGTDQRVFDQWLVLVFMLGRLFAGATLILSVANRRGVRQPIWAILLAISVWALASPTPYMMARPVVYEAAIASGQCFLFSGLVAALWGFSQRRWRDVLFVLAGICWTFALASRGSLILVAPLLALLTTASIAWRERSWSTAVRSLFALATPIGLGLVAYGYYNYERFDSPFEFGLTYQLTGRPFMNANEYLMPNVVSYAAANLKWSCHFPYARLAVRRHRTHLIDWPDDYDIGSDWNGERVAGVFVATTFCWLGLLWIWRASRWWRSREHDDSVAPLAFLESTQLWLLLCSLACSCALLPVLRMYMANMRFLEDGIGGLLIAAMLGGFWLIDWSRRATRPLLRAFGPTAYVLLALHTSVIGVLLGFTGQNDNFESENADLFGALASKLSVCRSHPATSVHTR
ncbi:MAG TPA: hypothetical protein VHZ95_11580 [Polyangiales bacterium]|nr:hypothetical protein [Polyangiales bacterium]